jgi:hypothetical protein
MAAPNRTARLAATATLIFAILPLGVVSLAEDFVAASVSMPVLFALLLEIPFAIASMFAYAAFEAAVAFLFKRTAILGHGRLTPGGGARFPWRPYDVSITPKIETMLYSYGVDSIPAR